MGLRFFFFIIKMVSLCRLLLLLSDTIIEFLRLETRRQYRKNVQSRHMNIIINNLYHFTDDITMDNKTLRAIISVKQN